MQFYLFLLSNTYFKSTGVFNLKISRTGLITLASVNNTNRKDDLSNFNEKRFRRCVFCVKKYMFEYLVLSVFRTPEVKVKSQGIHRPIKRESLY